MREPFQVINIDPAYLKFILEKKILILRCSRIDSCYANYWKDLNDPKRITEELNIIFDKGNDVHEREAILDEGARRVIDSEKRISIIHDSGKFIWTGQRDRREFDFDGRFIKDFKTTKFEGLYYFLKEGIVGYIPQLSGYSYLNYVDAGVYDNDGVIQKIVKDSPRDHVQRSGKLFPLEKTRTMILTHPVLLRWFGKIDETKFNELTVNQMKGEGWKCSKCVYKDECKVINHI